MPNRGASNSSRSSNGAEPMTARCKVGPVKDGAQTVAEEFVLAVTAAAHRFAAAPERLLSARQLANLGLFPDEMVCAETAKRRRTWDLADVVEPIVAARSAGA
jgi:hypothetical protein